MDPLTMMILGQLATTAAGALSGGAGQPAPAAPPPPKFGGGPGPEIQSFDKMWGDIGGQTAEQQPGSSLASLLGNASTGTAQPPAQPPAQAPEQAPMRAAFNPSMDPTSQAAATLTAAGAQPPVTSPVASKPATAMPDRAGTSMLPNLGGEMAGYYNDTPDPSQPLTAAGTMTPEQKKLGALSQGLSGLQDVVVPESQVPRPPSAVSPPGPTVRPDMSALMQMITAAGQRPQDDPRKAGLATMLMRG